MMFGTHRKRMAELALKSRLPAIWAVKENADAGGLMSYGTNFDDLYRRAAGYVDKILKGAKPADLPVEQPTKFELVINLKTAKALGLTIPQSVLLRADQLIQYRARQTSPTPESSHRLRRVLDALVRIARSGPFARGWTRGRGSGISRGHGSPASESATDERDGADRRNDTGPPPSRLTSTSPHRPWRPARPVRTLLRRRQ